jgi:hypothetical protein
MKKVTPIMKKKWDEVLEFRNSYVPGEIIKIEDDYNCLF